MKPLTFNPMKMTPLSKLPLVLLVSLMLSLTFVLPNVRAQQQQQLGLADIIIALRSNKVTLMERNEILTGAVKERGITFELTPQIEKELENTGADKALIEAIRQKSAAAKLAANPVPKPTPAATPVPTPTPVVQDFAFYKKQADENASKGEIEFALTNYNKAVELNPDNASIYLNRALAFYKKKDYEKAIADYDKVIEINPKELVAYANRANSNEKLGNTDKAVADYKRILELDEKNESALNNLKRIEDERTRALQKQQDAAAAAQAENNKEKPEDNKEKTKEDQAPPVQTKSADGLALVNLGRLSSAMAVEMATPVYSQIAKNLNLQGQVTVQVLINEEGKVVEVEATDGHRVLSDAAEQAARRSRFKPTLIDGKPVKAKGYIVYNFVR